MSQNRTFGITRLRNFMMGLPHCPHEGCVMRDAEASIVTVDAETGTCCESCAKAWREWLRQEDK